MERHTRLRISLNGEPCVPEIATGISAGPLVRTRWRGAGHEANTQTNAGTTYFYLSAKKATAAPMQLILEPQADYVLFLWNGQQPMDWSVATNSEVHGVASYTFFGTPLTDTAVLSLPAGACGIQCFGFSKPAVQLLASEFDVLRPLAAYLQERDPTGMPTTPMRFMPPKAHRYIDALRASEKQGFGLNLHVKDSLYQLVRLYAAGLHTLSVRRSVLDDAGLYDKAVALIGARFESPTFTVDALAQEMGLSRTNLYRLFEGRGQPSPHRHILSARLEKARELLRTSDLPIGAISALIGFEDPAHFSKTYKLTFGNRPTDDR